MNKNNNKKCPFRQFCGEYDEAMKVLKVITFTPKRASEIQTKTGLSLSKVYRILKRFEKYGLIEVGKMTFKVPSTRKFGKGYVKWATIYIWKCR